MIISFDDNLTADLYHGRHTNRVRRLPPEIRERALRKLDVLNGAHTLVDLRSPPRNRLEELKGDWAGYRSIRVNDQWRIVFKWIDDNAHSVGHVDYH